MSEPIEIAVSRETRLLIDDWEKVQGYAAVTLEHPAGMGVEPIRADAQEPMQDGQS